MIIRNQSREIKLFRKYNIDGVFIGESYVHLTSNLGVLARTWICYIGKCKLLEH